MENYKPKVLHWQAILDIDIFKYYLWTIRKLHLLLSLCYIIDFH